MKFLNLTITILLLLGSCVQRNHDTRLERIEVLAEKAPEEARDSLLAIDRKSLTDTDRHFLDFLTVKVNDKAYVTHTSDSLILQVIEHEARHRRHGRYAEALYYGGRVYSDLGDYPTALRYFQAALDEIEEVSECLDLKGRILSQYGGLLVSMRMLDEAMPIIQTSCEIDKENKDTVNLIYDLQLLGFALTKAEKYTWAVKYFREALSLSEGLPDHMKAKSQMHMASAFLNLDRPDSALNYIRGVADRVRPVSRTRALEHASLIYLASNRPDTAFSYARELLNSGDTTAWETAYEVLLSPEARKFSPADSLAEYALTYRQLAESILDRNNDELAVTQQTMYNYRKHLEEKLKFERKSHLYFYGILSLLFLAALLAAAILFFLNRNKSQKLELIDALAKLHKLKEELTAETDSIVETAGDKDSNGETSLHNASTASLREELQNELRPLYRPEESKPKIPEKILNSEAYAKMKDAVAKRTTIAEEDTLWNELEAAVLSCSPKFRSRLNLLIGDKLGPSDLHMAVAIKCGFTPSEMTVLFGRTNGAIISRRDSICMKAFDEKMSAAMITSIIRQM